jgi:hypothetical protein
MCRQRIAMSKPTNDWIRQGQSSQYGQLDNVKLKVKELLHILNSKPELNKQFGLQSSYEINTLLIKAYP